MSGGSYGYLHAQDASQLIDAYVGPTSEDAGGEDDHLRRMRRRLAALGYQKEAEQTAEILALIQEVQGALDAKICNLGDVWKAVEWCDSGDWGEDQLARVVKRHREKPTNMTDTNPDYYKSAGLEAIDIINAFGLDFCLGTALKYILRNGKKDASTLELRKSRWYLSTKLEQIGEAAGSVAVSDKCPHSDPAEAAAFRDGFEAAYAHLGLRFGK